MINLNSCELITLISTVACTLSKLHTKEELAMMASVFSQLEDSLATIIAHDELCCIQSIENTCTKNSLEEHS